MPKTSFGELEVLFKDQNKPQIEYLKFICSGRPHRHREFESFFTTKGSGKVFVGDKTVLVKAGDLVTIPPNSSHWMEPDDDTVLEGLLWYHAEPLNSVTLPECKTP